MTRIVSVLALVGCCVPLCFAAALHYHAAPESTYYGIANRLAAPEYRGKFVRVDFTSDAVRVACEQLGLKDKSEMTVRYFEDWHDLPHRDIKGGYLGPGVSDFRVFDLPYGLAGWMSLLKNESRLTALAIPGSHDSGTAQPEAFPYMVRTEEYSIIFQLLLGLRVFDIRPTRAGNDSLGRNDGTIWLYHGAYVGQGFKVENFGRVLNGVKMFLEMYPSETVIFILSHYFQTSATEVVDEMSSYLGDKLINMPTRASAEALLLQDTRGKLLYLPEEFAERNPGPNGADGTNDWNEMKAHLDTIPERRYTYNRFVVALTPQSAVDERPETLALKKDLPGLRLWLDSSDSDKIGIVEADYFGSLTDVSKIIAQIIAKNRLVDL